MSDKFSENCWKSFWRMVLLLIINQKPSAVDTSLVLKLSQPPGQASSITLEINVSSKSSGLLDIQDALPSSTRLALTPKTAQGM